MRWLTVLMLLACSAETKPQSKKAPANSTSQRATSASSDGVGADPSKSQGPSERGVRNEVAMYRLQVFQEETPKVGSEVLVELVDEVTLKAIPSEKVQWSIEPSDLGEFLLPGQLHLKAPGRITIKAIFDGRQHSFAMEVSDSSPKAPELELSADIVRQPVGSQGYQLSALIRHPDGSIEPAPANEVEYVLPEGMKQHADVEQGFVRMRSVGRLTVSARLKELTASIVLEATPSERVAIAFGCDASRFEKLKGCTTVNDQVCVNNPGWRRSDFQNRVRVFDPAKLGDNVTWNDFPVYVTAYRSDCVLEDVSQDESLIVTSSSSLLPILTRFEQYQYNQKYVVRYRGTDGELKLKATFRDANGKNLSAETPFRYRVYPD